MDVPTHPTLKASRAQDESPRSTRVGCDTCGAVLELHGVARTGTCPYCATATIVERPAAPDRPLPTFTVGFTLTRDAAEAAARRHLHRQYLAPEALRHAPVDDLRAVYLPAYLYGASATSRWTAEVGEDYQVEEEYTTVDEDGKRVTETRTRTETEWFPLEGEHAYWLRDVFVTASRGVANAELEAVQPFDLRALRRYRPELVAGWACEDPSLSRDECEQLARRGAEAHARRRVGDFLPGDRWRTLRIGTQLDHVELDLVLVPVWILTCKWRADRPPVRLVINGQTGQTGGKAPVSGWKIAGWATLFALMGLLVLYLELRS
ncbi:MAG: hypothetical protein H6709_14770 [Kofleriaceae bacterium]|nr:hypothetical protein [Kofleriaceae bacterium]MCB9573341.1 hypothetical protein [Kofleriaceae bacterium]